jgi:3-methyladenine DNA glycosylase/8-oxoguanine DNA glycosylase
MILAGGEAWRATRTPEGPVTTHLLVDPAAASVRGRAWGPGASWALDALPGLVGADDDDSAFEPRHPLIRELRRRLAGLRIPRSGAVVEALVPTVLEQKVTGIEATRSYRDMVAAVGEAAPGPAAARLGLMVPPAPPVLAGIPSWSLHRFGVERKRAETVRRVCLHARRLEEASTMAPADAGRRMTAVAGIGPWSAAQVALVALGDPDAVSVGDFHLPHQVAWALAGKARGDDDLMLQLLEPWRGQRGRVVRLIVAGGLREPSFGPRQPLRSWRSW